MTYNIEIVNEGALPTSYALKNGQEVTVGSLYKDKPLHLNVSYITGTINGQLELNCSTDKEHYKLILAPHAELVIKLPINSNVKEPISTTK